MHWYERAFTKTFEIVVGRFYISLEEKSIKYQCFRLKIPKGGLLSEKASILI
jgi:hypothetical protein